MMRRILIRAALVLSLAVAIPAAASAQSVQDTVLSELRQQGYTEISVYRTLLGRVRIEAESPQFYREIVLNPSTGAILRDYWRRKPGVIAAPQIFDTSSENGSEGGSPSGGSEDDDASDDNSESEDQPDEADEPDEPDSPEDSSDDGL